MQSEVLKAQKLNKYFNEQTVSQVLYDVSLAINKGEFVSIMGKSGCGKSTLLYLLSTLDTKYEGTVEINGLKVTGLHAVEDFAERPISATGDDQVTFGRSQLRKCGRLARR